MTPAQKRLRDSAALDQARNAAALGDARVACLDAAAESIAQAVVEQPAAPVRPYLRLLVGGAA